MPVRDRQATPSLLQIDAVLARLTGAAALAEVCRFLRQEFRQYRWVGVYRLDGATLVLEGWNGEAPTEHTRIPLAQGICGRAAREGRTVMVDDVRTAPEYLSCFLETRSEIVVPIRSPSGILGEIDIDGTEVGAYDESDRRFLEQVAEKLIGPLTLVAASSPASPSGPSP
jgi:GAF domain-containing protein